MISVTILTKNSSQFLAEVLTSTRRFDEVLILDNGSTDDTLTIARSFPNTRICVTEFCGFGPLHNKASSLAKHPWILSLDSDEVLAASSVYEILSTPLDKQCVYSLPRNNYFNGKWIRWCGWYPDRQTRLYNRETTRFTDALVHEAIIKEGLKEIPLHCPIKHYSYSSLADFLDKMQKYSTLFASQYQHKRDSSPFKAIAHGVFAFFKSYILKWGILGGYEGFVISAYNGHTAFYKYLKLYEKNGQKSADGQKKTGA